MPFKAGQERGLFVTAIHPDFAERLSKQIQRPDIVMRDDVYWLFSNNFDRARRRRALPLEPDISPSDPTGVSVNLVLSEVDTDGQMVYDLDAEEFEWVERPPTRKKWRKK